jgi:hypothetical protein
MASTNLDQQIRERIQLFIAELTTLIKQSAVKSVRDALGNGDTEISVRRGIGRSGRGRAKRSAGMLGEGVVAKRRGGRKKGAKRSPKQLENITSKLLAHIKANPGQRIEEVAGHIGMKTKELTLPIKKLVAEKKITKKGEKRATTYFVR